MSQPYAPATKALGICDRCGWTYKLKELKDEVVDLNSTGLLVCPSCFDPDQPQLQVGRWPVSDPQALRNARPDTGAPASRMIPTVDWDFIKSVDDPDGTNYLVTSSMTLVWVSGGTITLTGSTAQTDADLSRTDQLGGSRAIETVDLSTIENVSYFDGLKYPYVRMSAQLLTAWVGTDGATGWAGKLYWNTVGNDVFTELNSLSVSEPGWTAGDGVYKTVEWNLGNASIVDATCDTTVDSTTVTMDSTASLVTGMAVSGAGIDFDSTVSSIDGGGTEFELSKAATASDTNVELTFVAGKVDKLKILFNTDASPWGTPGAYEVDYIRVENN